MTGASRFLTGLVTCLTTHDGIPAVARAAWRVVYFREAAYTAEVSTSRILSPPMVCVAIQKTMFAVCVEYPKVPFADSVTLRRGSSHLQASPDGGARTRSSSVVSVLPS